MSEPTNRTKLMQIITEELKRSMTSEEERGAMKLIGLGIQSISPEAVELIRDSVERLSLQNNALTMLPQYFTRLDKLRYLDIHENKFTVFPEILTKMTDLEILDISFNSLSELPEDLGTLKNLKVLSLKNNNFETIPPSILSMKELRILELENNPFTPEISQFLNSIPYKSQTVEWLQEIKTFLLTNRPIVDEQHFTEGEHDRPTMLPAVSQLNIQQSKGVERSRSISESYVSTRAAKRMGFINVKKAPTMELSNEPIKEDEAVESRRNRSYSTTGVSSDEAVDTSTPHGIRHDQPSLHSRSNSQTVSGTASPIGSDKLDSIPEHRSNDYFKRLSILPETRSNLTQLKMVDFSRKILFAFSEFQSTMKKMNTFCSDKQVIIDMVSQLYASKTMIDRLVESLEKTDAGSSQGVVSIDEILRTVTQAVSVFKKMIETLTSNLSSYTRNTDICFVRMLLLSLFMSYSEVYNAFTILSPETNTKKEQQTPPVIQSRAQLPPLRIPDVNPSIGITQQQLNEYSEVDDKLYESLNTVLQSSSQVYSELNDAISKSAIANAKFEEYQLSASAIQKIKELTGTCVTSMDLNKKISIKLNNQNVRNMTLMEKKKFYDDINSLLKSIITILASTKAIMNESTILHEVRPSLASLTKATKDVTIMLEVSSYRMINDSFVSVNSSVPQSATTAPMISSIPSVMSIPQMNTPFINMPSTATPMQTAANPFEASMINNLQSMNSDD
jgi:hypothetical protein